MIRVLHVLASVNRGGAECMLMDLLRHIDRSRFQFDFAVCLPGKGDYEDEILSLGGKIIRYPRYRGYNHFGYAKWWRNFFSTHREYDIIHGHVTSTASIYLDIAKKNGIFTIAHSHSVNPPSRIKSLLLNIYSRKTRYIADYFMGCSTSAIIARFGKTVAGDPLRSRVFHNAIDVSKYIYSSSIRTKIRMELGISENEYIVGTVGIIKEPKNPHMIVDICKELRSRNVPFRFLWVGSGEMEEEIKERIHQEKLDETFIMAGLRDNVPEMLQSMDCFLFPSLWEGLGIAAIEAQAAGLPTLCSDRVPEEVRLTDLCEFYPLEDPEVWVDRIVKVKGIARRDTSKQITDHGFDVNATSRWTQSFYSDSVRKNEMRKRNRDR